MGRGAGEGQQLPNPHLLIRPFLRREAVLSSRIEGTQATLGELLAAEATAAVARSPSNFREVASCVVALEFGIGRLHELPPSLRPVRELHARLMEGVRGGDAHPGEFRRVQNWVGAKGCSIGTLPPLVQIALVHHEFEEMHPFLDGNGRSGHGDLLAENPYWTVKRAAERLDVA